MMANEEEFMANLRTQLEKLVADDGETIEAIVVGVHDNKRWDDEPPTADENALVPVETGLVLLDQDYNNGYGGADCRPFYAWTATKIYMVSEYDGATGIVNFPRHPTPGAPNFA